MRHMFGRRRGGAVPSITNLYIFFGPNILPGPVFFISGPQFLAKFFVFVKSFYCMLDNYMSSNSQLLPCTAVLVNPTFSNVKIVVIGHVSTSPSKLCVLTDCSFNKVYLF